ncbi:Ti-type conjugative transfer relaxase TraA, partial [Komagataeibacter sucrofermentans]
DEQALAVGEVTKSRDLSVVVGYAGTGKSTMLGVARAAWEEAGYRVRGAALSGIAAEGLEAGSGIESRTLASLERAWARGFDRLERGDVLVVDEAGMVGSRQMERVLSAARGAGAKVVLVGDPEQLQAIEAGGAFRAVAERVGSVEITTVRRQREGWQQVATKELATGRTDEALGRYEAAGLVRGHDTLEEARAGVVAGWDEARQAAPEESQIMLAHRRVDVRALNEAAREIRRDAGELGDDVLVPTAQGERVFADGERIYFLRNDRELGVKNGTLGTVRGIVGSAEAGDLALSVQLDGKEGAGRGRVVSVSVADYDALDHGYAATIHKSQGVTVDRAHVLATGSMDRHGAYVALSRHRESVSVHWGRDDVGDRDGLVRRLSRERLKDTTLDYPHVR